MLIRFRIGTTGECDGYFLDVWWTGKLITRNITLVRIETKKTAHSTSHNRHRMAGTLSRSKKDSLNNRFSPSPCLRENIVYPLYYRVETQVSNDKVPVRFVAYSPDTCKYV